MENEKNRIKRFLDGEEIRPLFLHCDSLTVLQAMPNESIDCCMTSPPYWGQRQYSDEGIGLEKDYRDYIKDLCAIIFELKRVLKKTGSFWLNIGDAYRNKCLLGIPWRVAMEMIDNQGWILRNCVVWNKVKGGPDNSKDKLRNVHEDLFHFVKEKKYYYDVDAIRADFPILGETVHGKPLCFLDYGRLRR